MIKVFRDVSIMGWTHREIQYDRACSIAITGNFQATSETIPRNFHKSSRVSSRASESSEFLEKSIQNRSQERLQGSQNRVKIDPGTLWARPVAPKRVPGLSLECLGASPACSGSTLRVCKAVPRGQKERREASGSAPRQPESTLSRVQE